MRDLKSFTWLMAATCGGILWGLALCILSAPPPLLFEHPQPSHQTARHLSDAAKPLDETHAAGSGHSLEGGS